MATDPLGNQTLYSHDPLDRLTQITNAAGGATAFGYDANGNLTSVTDANNNQTGYAYDARNRRVSRTDALGKTDSYSYDADGNLTKHTDRVGNVAAYVYDGLNRPAQASFSAPGHGGKLVLQDTITYTWDGGDRLTQAADSLAGTISRGQLPPQLPLPTLRR